MIKHETKDERNTNEKVLHVLSQEVNTIGNHLLN